MFSQPRIEEKFKQFVTVRLHTDKVPAGVNQVPDAEGALQLRDQKFQNFALPYYVIVRVKGKRLDKVAFYSQGLINDVEEFATFLDRAAAIR